MNQLDVLLRVGPVRKQVRVFGDREWTGRLLGRSITAPEPFAKLPLVWERAFGGVHEADPREGQDLRRGVQPGGSGLPGHAQPWGNGRHAATRTSRTLLPSSRALETSRTPLASRSSHPPGNHGSPSSAPTTRPGNSAGRRISPWILIRASSTALPQAWSVRATWRRRARRADGRLTGWATPLPPPGLQSPSRHPACRVQRVSPAASGDRALRARGIAFRDALESRTTLRQASPQGGEHRSCARAARLGRRRELMAPVRAVIRKTGLITPVGLGSGQTCAAIRAGVPSCARLLCTTRTSSPS